MRLEIRIRNIKCDDALRAYIRRRIGFALGRLSLSIRRVRISVNAGEGMRGDLGSECRITVRLIRAGSVVLVERAPDAYAAIDRTIERLGRGLSRHVDLRRRSDSDSRVGSRAQRNGEDR